MPFQSRRRGIAAAVLTFGLLPSTGCSWLAIHSPPQGPLPATPPVACETSAAPPVADTVGAVLLGLGGIGAITLAGLSQSGCSGSGAFSPCSGSSETAVVVAGIAMLGAATALAFSAGHGYSATAECRRLQESQLSCSSGVEEACRLLRERRER